MDTGLGETAVLLARAKDSHVVAYVAWHDVVNGTAEFDCRLKDRHRVDGGITRAIFEVPDSVRGFVGTRYDQVKVSITVRVAGDGPSP